MLYLYLGVSEAAISVVLIREEGLQQYPIYYISKALHEAELRYPPMEKLAYALITAARKLRPYFQEHSITVLTSYPLRSILHRPDTSGRLVKWAIELGQYDIHYKPRTAIKAQVLSDFITEFTPKIEAVNEDQSWTLYVDGSLTQHRAGGGIVLIDPHNRMFCHSVKFFFPVTNNEAEYEALLSGLSLAESMNVNKLKVFFDSQLLVNQVLGEFEVKELRLIPYLTLAKQRMSKIDVQLEHIPRAQNIPADALSKLASSTGIEDVEYIQVGHQELLSTSVNEVMNTELQKNPTSMTPVITYLKTGALPQDPKEARSLRIRAARFTLDNKLLYKGGYSVPLLKCITEQESKYVLEEVHEGICGNHNGARALAYKILRQGYY